MGAYLKQPSRIVLVLVAVLVAIWLVAPMLVVLPMSFTGAKSFNFPPDSWSTRWYAEFFSNPAWLDAVRNSALVAATVTVVATVLGTAASFALVRGRIPGRGIIQTLILAPMIVPVVIVAIGIYAVFLQWRLTGSFVGFVLAHTVLAVPFVVVTVSTALRTFDSRLEMAAASLGAGRIGTFRQVTLPLIAPGVLTGALFAFVTSFDEVVISLFLVSPTFRTLPVEMYSSVTREINPTIAAASSMVFVVTVALLLLALMLFRRSERRAVNVD